VKSEISVACSKLAPIRPQDHCHQCFLLRAKRRRNTEYSEPLLVPLVSGSRRWSAYSPPQ
jgi:hypothetical protein